MLYIVPGILAGIIFYLFLTVVNWFTEEVWPKNFRLRAHSRLAIHCLAAIAFTFFSSHPAAVETGPPTYKSAAFS